MNRLRDLFNPVDKARYLAWRGLKSKSIFEVQLRGGPRIAFRQPPHEDLQVAYEIFLAEAYRPSSDLPRRAPRSIVDVGANLGYSVLHWARQYPNAQILAFEPHPVHLRLLYQHIHANELTRTVRVEACALSNHESTGFLANQESESALTETPGADAMPIKIRDFFTEVGSRRIDLLKMDIEGGEYPILDDKRFETLDVQTIVLEWHNTVDHPDGRAWCSGRLTSLGFRVAPGQLDYGRAGVLWAWKP